MLTEKEVNIEISFNEAENVYLATTKEYPVLIKVKTQEEIPGKIEAAVNVYLNGLNKILTEEIEKHLKSAGG